MRRRLVQATVLFVVVFASAQLVRPERANPSTDPARTIRAHVADVETICAAARQVDTNSAEQR
jgi:hypothetical protein